jgi:hypothetical protein
MPSTPGAAPSAEPPAVQGSSELGGTATPANPRELLKEWTRALNAADMNALGRLYAERVRFYGTSLVREDVIERKRKALQGATFMQEITGEPRIEPKGDGFRVVFQKRSGPKGAPRDVLATLVLGKGPPLSIVEETDAVTQKRYGLVSAAPEAPKDCPTAVWLLVDSTPEAKRLNEKIEKNLKALPGATALHPGGMGPFMPEETGDGTYEVSIGVHHPDRFEAYGWFTVSAKGNVTASSFALDLFDASASPSAEARGHFARLCGQK